MHIHIYTYTNKYIHTYIHRLMATDFDGNIRLWSGTTFWDWEPFSSWDPIEVRACYVYVCVCTIYEFF